MEILTKFALGDKAWTMRDCKATLFEIGCIVYDGTVRYGASFYDTIPESQCFFSKEELLKYAMDDGNENM